MQLKITTNIARISYITFSSFLLVLCVFVVIHVQPPVLPTAGSIVFYQIMCCKV